MTSCIRRLVCAVLFCAVLLGVLSAAADSGIDLSAMSDAEVEALLTEVNAEIVRRGLQKTAVLPKGAYIAGRDLPAGRYVYTCLATGSDWGNVTVYADGGKGKQLLWHVVGAPDPGEEPETVFITLNDGDELKSGVPFSLTVMQTVQFK